MRGSLRTTTGIPAVNVYGVLAFSGLAGMFSRQAVEKLAEAFDVLFQKTTPEVEDRPLNDSAAAGAEDASGAGKPDQKPATVDEDDEPQGNKDASGRGDVKQPLPEGREEEQKRAAASDASPG